MILKKIKFGGKMNDTEYNWIINMENVEDSITRNISLYGRIYVTMSVLVELIDNIKKIWL